MGKKLTFETYQKIRDLKPEGFDFTPEQQKEAADSAGVSIRTVSNIWKDGAGIDSSFIEQMYDSNPDIDSIKMCSEVFSCSENFVKRQLLKLGIDDWYKKEQEEAEKAAKKKKSSRKKAVKIDVGVADMEGEGDECDAIAVSIDSLKALTVSMLEDGRVKVTIAGPNLGPVSSTVPLKPKGA